MPILNPCLNQINKYSFLVKDITTQQMYDDASIDLSSNVTAAKIVFKDYYDNTTYDINILSDWSYILGDGITINILDFPSSEMGGYDYFPDYYYNISVVYTYKGIEYTASRDIGFRAIISFITYQQLQQSDWKITLKCTCGCEKQSLEMRKFNYLRGLQLASKNCLKDQYISVLLALYKLTGTTHEYDS